MFSHLAAAALVRASQDSLPPRKRKVSHEHEAETEPRPAAAKLGLNGLHESEGAVVNWLSPAAAADTPTHTNNNLVIPRNVHTWTLRD